MMTKFGLASICGYQVRCVPIQLLLPPPGPLAQPCLPCHACACAAVQRRPLPRADPASLRRPAPRPPQTVWGVTPALHSPLMSVTNAISGGWAGGRAGGWVGSGTDAVDSETHAVGREPCQGGRRPATRSSHSARSLPLPQTPPSRRPDRGGRHGAGGRRPAARLRRAGPGRAGGPGVGRQHRRRVHHHPGAAAAVPVGLSWLAGQGRACWAGSQSSCWLRLHRTRLHISARCCPLPPSSRPPAAHAGHVPAPHRPARVQLAVRAVGGRPAGRLRRRTLCGWVDVCSACGHGWLAGWQVSWWCRACCQPAAHVWPWVKRPHPPSCFLPPLARP